MFIKKMVLASVLAALANSVFAAQAYPLITENYGVVVTFTRAPQRVVIVGQHETELLLALGLEKKISATSVWFGPLPDALAERGKSLKKLADNAPSLEAVTAHNPDLVLVQYHWHIGPRAPASSLQLLGIPTWVSPADCIGKSVADSSNGDGARSTSFLLTSVEQQRRTSCNPESPGLRTRVRRYG